jgi:hypothetical protein
MQPAEHELWNDARGGEERSARESLALIDGQRRDVRRRLEIDPAVLSAIWGVAWSVGFGVAYLAYGPDRVLPGWLGPTVPAVLMLCGVLASIGYASSVGRGVSGPSRTAAARYGWSWTLAFSCLAVVNTALIRQGLAPDTAALLWSASALLLVGVLYLAGGALFDDRLQYGVGVWTLLSATAAVPAGVPGNFLVMAIAGGGGFLGMAAYHHWRNPTTARPAP